MLVKFNKLNGNIENRDCVCVTRDVQDIISEDISEIGFGNWDVISKRNRQECNNINLC
jgi:hypothetical protein